MCWRKLISRKYPRVLFRITVYSLEIDRLVISKRSAGSHSTALTDDQILDLKGTPVKDQQRLLDIFLSVTSTKDDLLDTSFLTNLDMDPQGERMVTSPSSTALFSPTTSQGGLPGLLARAASGDAGIGEGRDTPKAFGDFRRLVSFATRPSWGEI